jgi:hypothetical protein
VASGITGPVKIGFLRRWQAERVARERASVYVAILLAEPREADVSWLAEGPAAGDVDHARWEWRYARRALGLLAAERDALDDLTASAVSAALARALRRNEQIAPENREIAARQFNMRLSAYRDVLAARGASESTSQRLGRVLLQFAGNDNPPTATLSEAGRRIAAYHIEVSDSLRSTFGAASLPENVAPSVAMRG